MKITDPEVIKNGERDLIASVQEDLDPDTVREILKERLAVATLSSKGGNIVVHDNKIAFRLDFEVNLSGSLLFDRAGNLIENQPSDLPTPKATEQAEQVEPDLNLEDDPDNMLTEGDEDPIDGLSIELPEYDLNEDLDDELNDEPDVTLQTHVPVKTDLEKELDELIDETELGDDDSNKPKQPGKDLDDDIDDILKESREFWEKKEES